MCKRIKIDKKDFDNAIDTFIGVMSEEFEKIKTVADTDEDGFVDMSEIRAVMLTEIKQFKKFVKGLK